MDFLFFHRFFFYLQIRMVKQVFESDFVQPALRTAYFL